jgi:hypothetical protein
MHLAHQRGHERLNNDWGYGYRQPYGYSGYSGYSGYYGYSTYRPW